MRTLACFIFLALVYTTKGTPSPHIIGGQPADIGEFPYQVSLKVNDRHKCSGSIINNRTILTAADCVVWLASWQITVHGGTNKLDTRGHVHEVESVTIHPKYLEEPYTNNIALVHLKAAFKYNPLEQSINLATTDIDIEDKSCTLAGWGATRVTGEDFSNSLLKIRLKGYSLEKCAKDWQMWGYGKIRNNQICTQTERELYGACLGDFGGPLVIDGVQIGILSMTSKLCTLLPDVYTKVTSFLPWILTNMKN